MSDGLLSLPIDTPLGYMLERALKRKWLIALSLAFITVLIAGLIMLS